MWTIVPIVPPAALQTAWTKLRWVDQKPCVRVVPTPLLVNVQVTVAPAARLSIVPVFVARLDPGTVPPAPAMVTTQPTSVRTKPAGSAVSVTLRLAHLYPRPRSRTTAGPQPPLSRSGRLNGVVKPLSPVVENVNGPPAMPVVIFRTTIVGCFVLVNVQTTFSPASMSSVALRAARSVDESPPPPGARRSSASSPASGTRSPCWRRAGPRSAVNVCCGQVRVAGVGVEVQVAGARPVRSKSKSCGSVAGSVTLTTVSDGVLRVRERADHGLARVDVSVAVRAAACRRRVGAAAGADQVGQRPAGRGTRSPCGRRAGPR